MNMMRLDLEKGGQTVMCTDSRRFQIRAYMHRQKLYNHKKQGWSDEGPYKLYIFQCDFMEMVRGSMYIERNLFHEKKMTMADNYFVMDTVIDWASNEDLVIIGANTREIPPKDT